MQTVKLEAMALKSPFLVSVFFRSLHPTECERSVVDADYKLDIAILNGCFLPERRGGLQWASNKRVGKEKSCSSRQNFGFKSNAYEGTLKAFERSLKRLQVDLSRPVPDSSTIRRCVW